MDNIDTIHRTADAVGPGDLVRTGEVTPAKRMDAGIRNIEQLTLRLSAVLHKLYDMAPEGAKQVEPGAGPLERAMPWADRRPPPR